MKTTYLALALAVAMQRGGAQHLAWMPLVAPLISMMPTATAESEMTCKTAKDAYKEADCCGQPTKALPESVTAALCPASSCPYSFAKPLCVDAEPQAPRDLTTGAVGDKIPKAATLNPEQAEMLPLVNVHFHLGAEHKSDEFMDGTDSEKYDGDTGTRRLSERRLAEGAKRPGWMCSNEGLTSEQLEPYTFQHCKGEVEVGKSYEVHYVHSSAGRFKDEEAPKTLEQSDLMADGLGGAANGRGLLNPMVVVQGQVYHIVNDDTLPADTDILHGWSVETHDNAVMYQGSTTGGSHNNTVCSPYAITWHVDLTCHKVSAKNFDNMCKQKKELYGLEDDLYPHHSRVLVSQAFVVQAKYVQKYPVPAPTPAPPAPTPAPN